MIKSLMNRIDPRDSDRLRDKLPSVLQDDQSRWSAPDWLSIASLSSALRPARSSARRAVSRTSHFAAAHPRKVGLGVGAAAVLAVGLYALVRSHETRKQEVREGAQVEPAE